jgi:alpha-beta hydrolase superfamily lysophospholipase
MRKALRWVCRRPLRAAGVALLTGFVLLNVLSYRHARAMTTFTPDGWERTAPGTWQGRPSKLSLSAKAGLLVNGVRLRRPGHHGHPGDVGLAYEVHTLPGEAGELQGWYVPREEARGLVLLFHGYGASMGNLLAEARGFHELGYACFLLDFRASGGSAGATTTIGYREADDVARAVAYARARWPGRPLILFGQSMGSAAVLRAVGELGVEADACVLECPFDRMLNAVKVRFRAFGLPAFPCAHLLLFWGGVQHGFNGFRHNPAEYARAVRCPVLLLNGSADSRVGRDQIGAVYDNLVGPKALHVFDGLGHQSYAARRPGEWKVVVGRFLDKGER